MQRASQIQGHHLYRWWRGFGTSPHCCLAAERDDKSAGDRTASTASTASTTLGGEKQPQQPKNTSPASKALEAVPGVLASAAVMQAGFMAADELGQLVLEMQGIAGKSPISGIPLAIITGMLLKNSPLWNHVSGPLAAGVGFCKDKLLKAGIICIGAKLSALEVATVGAAGVPAALAAVTVGLVTLPRLARMVGLPSKMGALIATGTSICGVTAISALSPAIRASQTDTAFAVANVVAFGTVNMLLMPYVAHSLLPTSEQAGIFLGLAVHDTAQVVGSALTYQQLYADDVAFQAAVVTKLTRNMLLVGVIPYMTWAYADRTAATAASDGVSPSSPRGGVLSTLATNAKKYIPAFVVGFAGMSLARSLGDWTLAETGQAFGVLDQEAWQAMVGTVSGDLGSRVLLGTAMAAVGMSTSFAGLKSVGWKPFAVGLTGAVLVSGTGLAAALTLPMVVASTQ